MAARLRTVIVTVGDATWPAVADAIGAALGQGRLAVLVGSGASQFSPANVPVAEAESRSILGELVDRLPADRRAAERLMRGMPFEILFGRLRELDDDLARSVVARMAQVPGFNPIHFQLATVLQRAAVAGTRLPVITTNYDTGIEDAWKALPHVVWRQDQVLADRLQEVFHIHGTAAEKGSLVLDYRGEFTLDRWKLAHLSDLAAATSLLVLGFSGGDLDISSALSARGVRDVIWVRSRAETCTPSTWTLAAQDLLYSARKSQVVINCEGRMTAVLDRWARVGAASLDADAIKARLDAIVQQLTDHDPAWPQLWARWTAVRAGVHHLAVGMTLNERGLVDSQARGEMRRFSSFYSGRYRAVARRWRVAARRQLDTGDLSGYLHLRTLEAESWNRAGNSPQSLATIASALARAAWTNIKAGGVGTASAVELRDLVATAALAWPLPPIYGSEGRLGRIARRAGRRVACLLEGQAFDKYLVLDVHTAEPDSSHYLRAKERYQWLGQRHRIINLQRVSVLRALVRHYSRGQPVPSDTARMAAECVRWARLVDDPVRLARSLLVGIEVAAVAGRSGDPRWEASARACARRAWWLIARSESWPAYWRLAHAVYLRGVRNGYGRDQRLRLLGLRLLETS